MIANSNRNMCLSVLAVAFVLWALFPSPALSAHLSPDIPDRYEPVKLANGVLGTPGTVAWSPDGKYLAYITDKVEIFDTSTGKASSVLLSKPCFLNWASERQLMALHGNGRLSTVDAIALKTTDIEVPPNVVAIYPSWDENRFMVFVAWSKEVSIGVEVGYSIRVMEPSDNSLTEVFVHSSILPKRYSGAEYLKGWMSAGPNPISGEAMLLRFVVPPNAPPYIKVVLLDASTGTSRDVLSRYRGDWLRAWGSWSPIGNRAALADENGRLRLLTLEGDAVGVDDTISGLHPSWDPRGGRIFFGGYLIDEDGGHREPVVPGAKESAGFFSPDGGRMALALDGDLWLLKHIEPSPKASAVQASLLREKVALLKELLSEGFIAEDEYYKRLTRILNRQGNVQ